jgi:hypothetical protein
MLQFVSPLLTGGVVFDSSPPLNETVAGLSSSTLDSYPLQFRRDLDVVVAADNIFSELGGMWALLAVAVITLRMKRVLVVPTTLLASGLIYALAVSVVTIYIPRYGDVVCLVGVLATLVAVADLLSSEKVAGGHVRALRSKSIACELGNARASPRS